MKHRLILVLIVTLLASSSPLAAQDWKAGVARANITPTKSQWMAGYGVRNKPSEGKLNDLWAKALVLEDASGQRVVLITLDLCGIDRALSARIRDRILQEHKLGRESIAISCSHTHSGPVVGENLRAMNLFDDAMKEIVREYTTGLEEKIAATVAEAMKNVAPAKLGWSLGKATFAVNRRNNTEKNVAALREKGELKGPSDHDLPVMTVTGADGSLKVILFGYACHATTTPLYEWSSDWPGVACTNLETAHAGATAMSWIGCGGDQNPLPRGSYKHLAKYGRECADAVEAALAAKDAHKSITPAKLATTYTEIDLPFGPLPTKDQLTAELTAENKSQANRAKILLAKLETEGQLSPHYPYPIAFWRLGDSVKWVMLGGEVVVDYSLRLKKELGPENTWVMAYTNDVMAYIPSERVLAEGRYEGEGSMIPYAQPTKWAPGVEELIVKEVHRQVEATK
jgi:neutral ceramidase